MINKLTFRTETINDVPAIEKITIAAFKYHSHSDQTEHLIISKLRAEQALSLSLVAELNGIIVGHIAFSKVKINNEYLSWFGLAPVSVMPDFQHKGIGSKLVRAGINAIKALGAKGCVLLGEPEYYSRFGFRKCDNLVLTGVPAEYFQALLLEGDLPEGEVHYHHAFS